MIEIKAVAVTEEEYNEYLEFQEKATPKKVIKLKKEQYGYTHQCPICEQLVGTIVMSRNNEFSPYIEEDDYCCSCGQALD